MNPNNNKNNNRSVEVPSHSEAVVVRSQSNMRLVTGKAQTKRNGARASSLMLYRSPNASAPMAPDLVPLCRCLVSSTQALFNAIGAIGQGTTTYVADPSGNATNSLEVFQWSTRFSGFQQYRIVKTTWVLTPLRTAVGTGSLASDKMAGYAIAWIEDSPQSGAPSQAVALATYPRKRVIFDSETIHEIPYGTNEPGDLNLSDINSAPTHIVGNSVTLGQHCLQMYTDNGFFGLDSNFSSGTRPLVGVQAIYDVEFFGIGGN